MTLRDRILPLLGTWSRPPDLPAKIALVVAAALALTAALGGGRGLLGLPSLASVPEVRRRERRQFVLTVAFIAGLLSIAYLAVYLRGGPRIIDATTYFLQGRTLAHGDFAWTPPAGPSASFRGRFLIYRELGPDEASLGGIFPPGYPLVLALGFLLGAPMIIGPLLAIGIVVATYHLARTLAEESFPDLAEPIARSAALLSVLCAALRYHTADTMSHGASALGVTIALTCALRSRRARLELTDAGDRDPFGGGRVEALFSGIALGYVAATRPVSAVPIALLVGSVLAKIRSGGRQNRLLVLVLLGALPGVFLLLVAQHEVTGSWLASTQRMYYTISDGPPGCFRWGFGTGTGCRFEHGDFVQARLEHGYGLVEAAGTTLRRMHAHLLDVANLEPLAVLALLPAILRRRGVASFGVLAATSLVGLQMLAYVPFYFDGDYPGGGARFFADVLPVEHALVMTGVACIVARRGGRALRFTRGAFAVLALAAAGFGVHASYEHVKLRDRDGGRPMFEPDVLARASVTNGLVFVDTDHGFALGHDPTARPDERVLVARLRNDDRDRMLWSAMGRPPTWLYKLEPDASPTGTNPTLTPYTPPESGALLEFEAEAEWPALAQEHGFAAPAFADACASGKRALVLTAEPGQRARATITIPIPAEGDWSVEVHTVAIPTRGPPPDAAVTVESMRWPLVQRAGEICVVQPAKTLSLRPPHALLTLEAAGSPIGIDYVALRRAR